MRQVLTYNSGNGPNMTLKTAGSYMWILKYSRLKKTTNGVDESG